MRRRPAGGGRLTWPRGAMGYLPQGHCEKIRPNPHVNLINELYACARGSAPLIEITPLAGLVPCQSTSSSGFRRAQGARFIAISGLFREPGRSRRIPSPSVALVRLAGCPYSPYIRFGLCRFPITAIAGMDSGKPSGILSWQTTENELRLLEIEADELSFCARKSATLC